MGRQPTYIIRIEYHLLRNACTLYIGRACWYDADRPDRITIRRDRGGINPHICALLPVDDDRGWKVSVPTYRMPHVQIGRDHALELGLVAGVYTGRVHNRIISFDLTH